MERQLYVVGLACGVVCADKAQKARINNIRYIVPGNEDIQHHPPGFLFYAVLHGGNSMSLLVQGYQEQSVQFLLKKSLCLYSQSLPGQGAASGFPGPTACTLWCSSSRLGLLCIFSFYFYFPFDKYTKKTYILPMTQQWKVETNK